LAEAAELRKKAKERRGGKARLQEDGPEAVDDIPAFERTSVPPLDRSRVVTIVAGLPRSGTSMMMQMLAAGGLEPYTDHQRALDESNPRGYFEHENATWLYRDASWISETRGKVVKIVAHLLPHLPAGDQYRIVFLHRQLDEVVASQRAMLARLGRPGGKLDSRVLARTYTRQLVQVQTWLQRSPDVQVLPVNYADALRDPAATSVRLARFLGPPFDESAAAMAVDGSLRRQASLSRSAP
jgi:hypothetical protein